MNPLFHQFKQHVNGVCHKKVEHDISVNVCWIILFHVRGKDCASFFPKAVLPFHFKGMAKKFFFRVDLPAYLLKEFLKKTVRGHLNLRKETFLVGCCQQGVFVWKIAVEASATDVGQLAEFLNGDFGKRLLPEQFAHTAYQGEMGCIGCHGIPPFSLIIHGLSRRMQQQAESQ